MNNPTPNQSRVIDEAVYDGSGSLIAQKIFEITTTPTPEHTCRSVKEIIRFKDKDNGFKEIILTQANAVVPNNDEANILMKHLFGSELPLNNEIIPEEVPVLV